MSRGMSLHVASGRFTSVLNPKQIVGFVPWQDVNRVKTEVVLLKPCPFCPQVQTSSGHPRMSVLCHQRTFVST
jgi:hypothetical protein